MQTESRGCLFVIQSTHQSGIRLD